MRYQGLPDEAEQGPVTMIEAGPGESRVEVPGRETLLESSYERSGDDLVLKGAEGETTVVRDYFSAAEPPLLTTADGAEVGPELVRTLAGPLAPAQIAQAGTAAGTAPIGEVSELSGDVQVTRTSGVQEQLALGDPIFQGDSLETGAGASVGITFIDDTIFSLGESGQIVIDDVVFNPGGSDNALLLSLLQGSFAFLTGKIPPSDGPGMEITTPAAVIGIRGTAGVGEMALAELLIGLIRDLDPDEDIIDVFNNIESKALANLFEFLRAFGMDVPLGAVEQWTEEQVEQSFPGVLASMRAALATLLQEQQAPEAGPEDQDGQQDGNLGGGPNGSGGGGLVDPAEEAEATGNDAGDELGNDFGDASDTDIGDTGSPLENLGTGGPGADGPSGGPPGNGISPFFNTFFDLASAANGDSTPPPVECGSVGPIEPTLTLDALAAQLAENSTINQSGDAMEGSAIKRSVTLEAGDILTFDFNFLEDEITPTFFNDFAFANIAFVGEAGLVPLADTNSDFTFSATQFNEETGCGTFSFTAQTSGTYVLGIGVVDVGDMIIDAGLLVDNFEVNGEPLENGGFEDGDFGGWETVGDTRIVDSNFGSGPTEGTQQAFLSTLEDNGGNISDAAIEEFLGLTDPGSETQIVA